jgi:hypothetical protein
MKPKNEWVTQQGKPVSAKKPAKAEVAAAEAK